MSNAEFVAALSQERNRGFNTAVGTAEVLDRNTIPACVHGAQSVTDGQTVRLRLLEPMAVAGRTIPRGAVVVGTGKIQGERLDIEICLLYTSIGDNRLCLHTLSDAEDLPGKVATDTRYEKLSTDRSDCRLSFASPVGLLLSCNHIYNQYVLIDNSEETLQKFEKSARNIQSLSRYSRSNSINREWIDQYQMCIRDSYMVGIDQWICIGFGAASSSVLVWQTRCV